MARYRNTDWDLPEPKCQTWEQAQMAVLMDIRDELEELNRNIVLIRSVVGCSNTSSIPHLLRSIKANTAKKKRKKLS